MDGEIPRDADIEVAVRAGIDAAVETLQRLDDGAPIHDGPRRPDEVLSQQFETMIFLDVTLRLRRQGRSIGGDGSEVAIDEGAFGMGGEGFHAGLDRFGKQTIIGVKENHVGALAGAKAGITGARQTLVALPEASDLRIARRDLRGVISRAVVHDDDLVMRPGLIEDTFNGVGEEASLVVTGNYNRNFRL